MDGTRLNIPVSSSIMDGARLHNPMEELRGPEWSCSDVLRLIKEYGKRPLLWNPDNEDFKDRFRKHQKWMELAAIFKCSKLEVERKMKILNSQYRRERLKAMRMRKLGKTHRATWYGYKAFSFMNEHWVRFRNRSNLMASDGNGVKEEQDDEFSSSATELIPFFDDDGGRLQENETVEEASSETPPYISEDPVSENKDEASVKLFYDNKDEWALFGDLVAHALRKLPDDRSRCIVKHKINTVLYEAELATYEKSE